MFSRDVRRTKKRLYNHFQLASKVVLLLFQDVSKLSRLIVFFISLYFNGKKSRKLHYKLIYLELGLFLGTTICCFFSFLFLGYVHASVLGSFRDKRPLVCQDTRCVKPLSLYKHRLEMTQAARDRQKFLRGAEKEERHSLMGSTY